MHTSHSHGQVIVHVAFLDSFARFHPGTACSRRQAGAERVGGSVAPSAQVTSAFPSVESAFTTSISYAPFHRRISPSRTVTGEMPCAERERNKGWCVHTGGPGCTSVGLKTSSTTSRLAKPAKPPIQHPTATVARTWARPPQPPPPPFQQAEAFLELQGGGGVRMRRIRLNPRMTPIGDPLGKQCPLHLLPGGRGEPVVPGSADHDEDVPLLEEDLVPPLIRGLPQRRSHLDVETVLGRKGHEGGEVAAGGVAVKGGEHVGGGGDIRVRELVPRLSSRHDDRTRHLKQVLERIGDTNRRGVNKLFNKGTSQPPGFGGLGLVPLRKGGVLPLFLHRFRIEHRVKVLRNLIPPPNFFHLPPGGLAVLREKNIAVDCVAEAVHEVDGHRGGWAVSLHGGVSGGIRGGVLQG